MDRFKREPVYSDMEELEIGLLTIDELVENMKKGELSLLPAVSILALATNPLLAGCATVAENTP